MPKLFHGWRGILLAALLASTVALVLNVVLLAVSLGQPTAAGGSNSRIVFKGNCKTASRISITFHVLINILSTILLAASNASVQILSAPTRCQIETKHASGHCMQIGKVSFRNILAQSGLTKALCVCLALSSVPLHFLYNSVIYEELTPFQYAVAAINDRFFTSDIIDLDQSLYTSPLNHDAGHGSKSEAGSLYYTWPSANWLDLTRQARHATEISWQDCVRTFKQGAITYNRAFLLHSEYANESYPIQWLHLEDYARAEYDTSADWQCWGTAASCAFRNESATTFTFRMPRDGSWSDSVVAAQPLINVKSCRVLEGEERCTVNLNIALIGIVIACNLIKMISIVIMLLTRKEAPLLTMGDAISSFIQKSSPVRPVKREVGQYRRCQAPGIPQFVATIVVCLVLIIVTIALTSRYGLGDTSVQKWNLDKTTYTSMNLLDAKYQRGELVQLVLIANLPQFLVSFAYLFYNNLVTTMQAAAELAEFAIRAKPLRVTAPDAGQKSTHFLQIPLRYAVPLMLAMATMHWLISESLAVVNIRFFPGYDAEQTGGNELFLYLVWNPATVALALGLGGGLVLFLLITGGRSLPHGMPLVRNDSIMLAELCRERLLDEGSEITSMPLRYGRVDDFNGFTAKVELVTSVARPPIQYNRQSRKQAYDKLNEIELEERDEQYLLARARR